MCVFCCSHSRGKKLLAAKIYVNRQKEREKERDRNRTAEREIATEREKETERKTKWERVRGQEGGEGKGGGRKREGDREKERFMYSVFTKGMLDEKGQARDTKVHVTL